MPDVQDVITRVAGKVKTSVSQKYGLYATFDHPFAYVTVW